MAALAMREYPALNISLDGGAIRKHADINIGLAVALDDGLLVVLLLFEIRQGVVTGLLGALKGDCIA